MIANIYLTRSGIKCWVFINYSNTWRFIILYIFLYLLYINLYIRYIYIYHVKIKHYYIDITQAFVLWYIDIFLFINCFLSSVFRGVYECVLCKLHLVSFSMWQKVKSSADGITANGLRALTVSSQGPAQKLFGLVVTVLSTWYNGKRCQHFRQHSTLRKIYSSLGVCRELEKVL